MSPQLNVSLKRYRSFLENFDPRVKLLVTFVALGAMLATERLMLPGLMFVSVLAALLALNLKKTILIRLFAPLIIGFFLFLTQGLWFGHTPVYHWQFGVLELTFYQEGMLLGGLLAVRVMAGASLLLFLTLTTNMEKLIYALKWLRVPTSLIEIMTVAYRYVHIFQEEIARVRKAQKIRFGYISWSKTFRATAGLSGIILVRAFDKSERLYNSMLGRGYTGNMNVASDMEATVNINLTSLILGLTVSLLMILAV